MVLMVNEGVLRKQISSLILRKQVKMNCCTSILKFLPSISSLAMERLSDETIMGLRGS